MELVDLLKIAVERKASDLHIKVGMPPVLRIDHKLVPLMELPRLGQDAVVSMAASVMSAKQRERFKERNEADLAYGVPGLGRFRVNIFQQRGMVGIVLRLIPLKIQTVRELNLPPVGVVVSYTEDPDLQSGRKFLELGLQTAAGVPLQCDEPADFRTFRIGLFGLDKLASLDRTVERLGAALRRLK